MAKCCTQSRESGADSLQQSAAFAVQYLHPAAEQLADIMLGFQILAANTSTS
jgi:hypothetical protein